MTAIRLEAPRPHREETSPLLKLPPELVLFVLARLPSVSAALAFEQASLCCSRLIADPSVVRELFKRQFPGDPFPVLSPANQSPVRDWIAYKDHAESVSNIDRMRFKARTVQWANGKIVSCFESLGHEKVVLSGQRRVEILNLQTGASRLLESHGDLVTCIKVLGNKIISGSFDTTLGVWDAESGARLGTLTGHTGEVACLIDVDSKTVASGSWDSKIKIWDVDACTLRGTLEGHSCEVLCLDRVDTETLVSGDEEGGLRRWNLKTGDSVVFAGGHPPWIKCLKVFSQGTRMVSCAANDEIFKIWNLETNALIHSLNVRGVAISHMSVRNDSGLVYYGQNGQVVNWRLDNLPAYFKLVAAQRDTRGFVITFGQGHIFWMNASAQFGMCKGLGHCAYRGAFQLTSEITLLAQLDFYRVIAGCSDGKVIMLDFRPDYKPRLREIAGLLGSEERHVVRDAEKQLHARIPERILRQIDLKLAPGAGRGLTPLGTREAINEYLGLS